MERANDPFQRTRTSRKSGLWKNGGKLQITLQDSVVNASEIIRLKKWFVAIFYSRIIKTTVKYIRCNTATVHDVENYKINIFLLIFADNMQNFKVVRYSGISDAITLL